jgi:hypothetical protein
LLLCGARHGESDSIDPYNHTNCTICHLCHVITTQHFLVLSFDESKLQIPLNPYHHTTQLAQFLTSVTPTQHTSLAEEHFEEIKAAGLMTPTANQIPFNPYHRDLGLLHYHRQHRK